MAQQRTITTTTAGAILDLCPSHVRRLARTHGLGIKAGRDWLFTRSEVDRIGRLPGPGRPYGAKDRKPRTCQTGSTSA